MMINDLTGNTKAFAEACYDNSISELEAALENGADSADMAEWGINSDEWRIAVTAALNELRSDA